MNVNDEMFRYHLAQNHSKQKESLKHIQQMKFLLFVRTLLFATTNAVVSGSGSGSFFFFFFFLSSFGGAFDDSFSFFFFFFFLSSSLGMFD